MRTVAVVTTSRADYSHLYWVLRELQQHAEIDLRLIVTGAHLSPEFGLTVEKIAADGFEIDARVEALLGSDSDVGMAKTIGVAALGLADTLGAMRPDLLLLIADRYEMLAPAAVALALRIPIAHIEGGDVSEGAIDQAVRDALTKMSHLHFTPTASSRDRVLSMGEEAWRVHRTGAPSLDHIRRSRIPERAELETELELVLDPPPLLVAYHPVTIARDSTREIDALFEALATSPRPVVFSFPNADTGSRTIIARAERFCRDHASARLFVDLGAPRYMGLLRCCAALVGNSSSGIMEAASFELPVVDIGMRQQGRLRAANVLDALPEAPAIRGAIERALDPRFRESLQGLENPYGDGDAARRIVEQLAATPLGEPLLLKRHVVEPGASGGSPGRGQ